MIVSGLFIGAVQTMSAIINPLYSLLLLLRPKNEPRLSALISPCFNKMNAN